MRREVWYVLTDGIWASLGYEKLVALVEQVLSDQELGWVCNAVTYSPALPKILSSETISALVYNIYLGEYHNEFAARDRGDQHRENRMRKIRVPCLYDLHTTKRSSVPA